MKQMKRYAALVLALALLVSLLPTLSVPAEAASRMDPTITNGILTWQPLDGAVKYAVWWNIDGWSDSYTSSDNAMLTSTSYNLQAAMDADIKAYSGRYTIQVYAYRSSGIRMSVEAVQFNYTSSLPQLEKPRPWFEGTTVRWYPVENADSTPSCGRWEIPSPPARTPPISAPITPAPAVRFCSSFTRP